MKAALKNVSLLLVEDDPDDARLVREMLAPNDAENRPHPPVLLEHRATLAEGMAALERMTVDAVLLDLSLPDSKGLDSFRKMQTAFPQLPIVIVTGLDDTATAVQAMREGAQDYLVKNRVRQDLLFQTVRYAIERKRIQEENNRIQAQLLQAQKREAVGVLTGGLARDFSNLVTAIRGSVDMALFKVEAGHPAVPDLKNIRSAVGRAGELTRQMLLFSQMVLKEFVAVQSNDVIEDCMTILHRILGEHVSVQIHLDPGLWTVNADPGLLAQALINLGVRAREAMPAGGTLFFGTGNVSVDEGMCRDIPNARPGRFVRVSVVDNGPALDDETLTHVFDPFYVPKGAVRGMGLGVSVVHSIVREHEGFIHVHAAGETGTAFELYLPTPEEKTKAGDKPAYDLLKGGGERILVVEDEEGIREFVRHALGGMGYDVTSVIDAGEAAKVFRSGSGAFDLVFIDVVLPDRSGIDLADELRRLDPKIKILLSSGYMDHRSQWPVIEERGYPFLQKPYSLTELLKTVKRVLGVGVKRKT